MDVPLLLITGKQQVLVEAARAFVNNEPARFLEEAKLPQGLTIDHQFPPVPLRMGDTVDIVSGYRKPESASTFLVRCFTGITDPSEIEKKFSQLPIFADPAMGLLPICGDHPAVGSVADVANRLNLAALFAKGLDGSNVALAIVDSGIAASHLREKRGAPPRIDAANSFTPGNIATEPGNAPFDHGTMCAYDALIAAPNATLLDYPMLLTRSGRDEHTVASTIGAATASYAQLIVDWAVTQKLQQRYKALVVSNSWGIFNQSLDFSGGASFRYTDKLNHPFHYLITALADAGADIVFAAGNCGSDCPSPTCLGATQRTIWGANAYAEVLTVAGCDTTDHHVGYSSRGPSIFNAAQDKPDLTAYTHFLGSEVDGDGEPDGGTSAACPIAAGCVAALRTSATMWPGHGGPSPSALIKYLRANARPGPGTLVGWNPEYGCGTIDPVATATALGL